MSNKPLSTLTAVLDQLDKDKKRGPQQRNQAQNSGRVRVLCAAGGNGTSDSDLQELRAIGAGHGVQGGRTMDKYMLCERLLQTRSNKLTGATLHGALSGGGLAGLAAWKAMGLNLDKLDTRKVADLAKAAGAGALVGGGLGRGLGMLLHPKSGYVFARGDDAQREVRRNYAQHKVSTGDLAGMLRRYRR